MTTVLSFKVTPILMAYMNNADCPIDAGNLHQLVKGQFAAFDGYVSVNHQTGDVKVIIENTLTQTQLDAIKNKLKQFPQYVSGIV